MARVPQFPAKLRESNPRTGFVTDEEYDALLANCRFAWLRGLLAVAYNFGFRRSELMNMRASQVSLADRTIVLLPGTTKNNRGRVVAMTDDVLEALAPCVKGKKTDDFVFTWDNGKRVRDFRFSWDKMCTAAGKSGLLLHDFRRSAVRNMVRAGVSKHIAKSISGHVTDEIFDRYDIGDTTDLIAAAQQIQSRRENSRRLDTESSRK